MTARALFWYAAISLAILGVAACFVDAAPIFKAVLLLGAIVAGAAATNSERDDQ